MQSFTDYRLLFSQIIKSNYYIHLALLKLIFAKIELNDLVVYIKARPTSKYTRRIWFFFEFITERLLPIEGVKVGNYIDALDRDDYFTITDGEKSQRQRVINNLLGPVNFCPIVRKTSYLCAENAEFWQNRCEAIVSNFPSALLHRALNFLYSKETKSSFAIEHLTPSATRIERFMAALQLAESEDFVEKRKLVELQNLIVDPRFKDHNYRLSQNYVGQSVAFQKEIIHYVCPKPDDLVNLMAGLLASHQRMSEGQVPPVVQAAVIAYGFVFLHPFEDGNGRIHRFLIHNILARRGWTPRGLMLPVSAVMLKNMSDYDASLEAFSKPLLQVVNFELDEMGCMTVNEETQHWYQFMDLTAQAEALLGFVRQTVEKELVSELALLASYDNTRKAIREIIDMPDRLIDRFIQLCLQNNGRLSARKKVAHFDFLSPDELVQMEQAVQDGYISHEK